MDKNNLEKFQHEFANATGMLASRFSLSPTVGQIYGLLYLSPQPVSLDEMVEKLGISKGSASTNVRVLESWNAANKVWVNNSRKDYYEANPDILEVVINRIKQGLRKRIEEVESRFKFTNIKNLDLKNSKNSDFLKGRLKKLEDIYLFISELLKSIPLELEVEKSENTKNKRLKSTERSWR